MFYSYMPLNVTDTWTVSYSGIACDSNVWQNTNCTNYKAGYQGIVEPNSIEVSLPTIDVPEFTWK